MSNSHKKWHVRLFDVDGVNLDDKPFVINNELMFSSKRAGETISNIVNAHVVIKRPLWKANDNDQFMKQHLKDQSEALEKLSIFLATYHLATNNEMPKIYMLGSSGYEFDENDKLDKIISSFSNNVLTKSEVKTLEPNQVRISLEKTIPLYEKVTKILDSTDNQIVNSLRTALIVYHRGTLSKFDDVRSILDFITVLEALYSNPEDLKYKFALRNTLVVEKTPAARRELFDFLNEAYKLRNKFVHGLDIELGHFSELTVPRYRLMKITAVSLLKFIELGSMNKTKKEIIDHIDNIALGLEKTF